VNFNYTLVTGDSSISGSLVEIPYSHRRTALALAHPLAYYTTFFMLDRNGEYKEEAFPLDINLVDERHQTILSYNSQTMLEETPTTESIKYGDIYSLKTGDYLTINHFGYNLCYFDYDPASTEDVVFYNKRPTSTGIAVTKYGTTSSVSSSLTYLAGATDTANGNASSISELFENYDVFLNGQKITESDYPADTVTGKLFSIQKVSNTVDIKSDTPDLYGTGFIQGLSNLYLNGMEQDPFDMLALYTGVTMVETGIQASFFLPTSETDTYTL